MALPARAGGAIWLGRAGGSFGAAPSRLKWVDVLFILLSSGVGRPLLSGGPKGAATELSLIHISEPTRLALI
eukprot:15471928-Alexandrium_andersonii.AAC.1